MAELLQGRALGVEANDDGVSPLAGPVDLSLSAGEVVAIRGPSGSGKTTLLRCLALLETDAVGEVVFRGSEVDDADVPAFRRQVVYVAQTPPPFPMTAGESLARAFSFSSAQAPLDFERARDIARRLLLPDDVMGRRLAELSGGEAQRVAAMRALLLEPCVLLLDEPTSALDPAARDSLVTELRGWLDTAQRAAAIVSHDHGFVSQLATRKAVLRDGELFEQESE